MIMKYEAGGEFKNVYRPRSMEYVVGHEFIKSFLINSVETCTLPRVLMFCGQRGVGKTTIARIIAAGLNCEKGVSLFPCGICENCRSIFSGSNPDFQEINVGDKTGIDNIRALGETLKFSPMYLRNKIFILDECHKLTAPAQDALLKSLEDTPKNVYIIFCTTSKENLLPTLLDRCYDFYFEALSEIDLLTIVDSILLIEDRNLDRDIITCLLTLADGSARRLVVNLQKVLSANVKSIKEVAGLLGTEIILQQDIKHLSKAIMENDNKKALAIIAKYSYSDCDLARKSLINYLGTILLRTGKENVKKAIKISRVIDILSSNTDNPARGLFINDIFKITTLSGKAYV